MITGGVVDGPLTADSAISVAAARANGVESKVAGNANVLIVPGLEAGALLLRTITGMFGALAAGVTLGATVPVVLSSRGESMEVRMAACVLASLVAAHAAAGTAERKTQPSTPAAVVGVAA